MGSGMRGGFDEVQKLPGQVPYYALEGQSNDGRLGLDPSRSFLPPILPQIQTNLHIHPFHPAPLENLPPLSGLHITTTSAPHTRHEGPYRTASSPNHTSRFSPYERPKSAQRSSPTQRAVFPQRNPTSSPEVRYQSQMRLRQEANPPPLFDSTNVSQITQQAQQPLTSSRANSVNPVMSISNLIMVVPITELYSIRVRQQPHDARMCGNGLGDRRHIDPPPVVQLFLNDPTMNIKDINKNLVVMHCLLYNAEEDREERLTESGNRILEGGCVQGPTIGPDEFNNECALFLFADLSCRNAGRYRLQFRLSVTPHDTPQNQSHPFLAECMSDVFTVSLATGPARFPGMSESTPLTKALKAAGANVKLRRGTAASSRPGARAPPPDSSEGETQNSQSSGSKTAKQRKKMQKK